MADIKTPALPAKHDQFLEYVAEHPKTPMAELLQPYRDYDAELRKIFAQQSDHPAIKQPSVVPVFTRHEHTVRVRARDLKAESDEQKASYIMPLKREDRKPDGAPAIVQSLREFTKNFNVFSESSLADVDWSNVVVAGSAVVTSLLSVPQKQTESKGALRRYYHEEFAPASDVDLFLYGLTDEQAIEKIKEIERKIRDALLVETTTVRTKNAITIASQYPTRHVQIVLRIYRSISEILTGFDVDCSCAAYDGQQVYCSPRALAAYMTQINTIDLTRRSPSYESRLSKYAHRGFEIYWPNLDRTRIDPTIFERSFGRTEGLARLLILEKLPKSQDREAYLDQRRAERGRPPIDRRYMRKRLMRGNIKTDHEDEVADWVDSDEVSDYHTFTIPYGRNFHARKIEKLLYTKDLLLNAEWNKPKDREVNLHRHPAFFGTADDVMDDCCGYCPKPSTIEEEEVAEEENKVYISGDLEFIKHDPGRQAIGSFNPLTADDWTEMAYVSNTAMLCQAIVEQDVDFVRSWLGNKDNDPNARDWTGRTPLHLAVANSKLEIVQLLIDGGARLVARLVDGKTALHLAAIRGSVEIVSALLRKSEANEEAEEKKLDAKRAARKAAKVGKPADVEMKDAKSEHQSSALDENDDVDMVDDADGDEDVDATTENSLVNIKNPAPDQEDKALANYGHEDEPDVYDVNIVAWDTVASPLHFAIIKGHVDVVKCLVTEFGADVLLPIKLIHPYDKSARAAILTLVLALQLPMGQAEKMTRTLIELGASAAQADMAQRTVLQYCIADRPDQLQTLIDADKPGVDRAINHLAAAGNKYGLTVSTPLLTAIMARDSLTALRLLSGGAKPEISFEAYMKAYQTRYDPPADSTKNRQSYESRQQLPVIAAVECELPFVAKALIDYGANPNTLTRNGYRILFDVYMRRSLEGKSLLDVVQERLEQLRAWKFTPARYETPTPLREDDSYLSAYPDGSYRLWSAKNQLESAKRRYKDERAHYKWNIERAEDRTGVANKEDAVRQLTDALAQLEIVLIDHGAKSFKDIHPEVGEPEKREQHSAANDSPKSKEFEIEFSFKLPAVIGETLQRYIELFEAVWRGDVRAVKQLTLLAWKDSQGDDHPPLNIAVQDNHGLSPYAVAVIQGHLDLATAIMEIAQAQYEPPESPKEQRYRLDGDASGYESDDQSGDDVQLYSEIVDDQFTVETIGEVSMQVKSRTTPLTMLQWSCPVSAVLVQDSTRSSHNGFSYFGPRRPHVLTEKRTTIGSTKASSSNHDLDGPKGLSAPSSLLQLALFSDNEELLLYLLQLAEHYSKQESMGSDNEDGKRRFFTINDDDFHYALRADRPALLETIVKQTGAGIPLNKLAKKSGVEMKEKPKGYQGLSVHGLKRKDWADAGRQTMSHEPIENHHPPLLESARLNSLKIVEWFLGDAPMRCYRYFAECNRNDSRLQRLSQAADGFEALVTKFLQTRAQLSIHAFLIGGNHQENDYEMLRYLVSAMPTAVHAKSMDGLTPLHIAFELLDEGAAKILIEAGADQTCRDVNGNNIVHRLLTRSIDNEKRLRKLVAMLDLVDSRILPSLFLERSSEHSGSLTPLARWISTAEGRLYDGGFEDAEVMRTILRYSKGEELSLINGEGDTPLHVLVKRHIRQLVHVILEHDPTLLNRENATGRTPFDMAEDAAMAAVCSNPPPLPEDLEFNNRHVRQLGLPSSWNQDIVSRAPESFVKTGKEDHRNGREMVWGLVREVEAKLNAEGKAKRRIVTLNEANEVARRLAAMKAGVTNRNEQTSEGAGDEDEDQTSASDEVRDWLRNARLRV